LELPVVERTGIKIRAFRRCLEIVDLTVLNPGDFVIFYQVRERILYPAELSAAERLWVSNAVHGLIEVKLVENPAT
jgi:hypothetical protein